MSANFFLNLTRFMSRWPGLSMSVPITAVAVSSLVLVINSWVAFDMSRNMAMDNEVISKNPRCQQKTFDYIIVGSGASGMVVATRLANASRHSTVLLLEAGGEPHIMNHMPAADFFLMDQPANTWVYRSDPQLNSSCACDGKRTVTTRGRMLGGSTSTNFMLYARGHKEDFNRWQEDAGSEQWNYENLLPYFKKSEDYHGAYENDESSRKYHGAGGLLNIATPDYQPGVEEFLAAGLEKGHKIGDYNGDDQEVFSKIDITTQNGWRESTYRAFYLDTGKPSNLCIKKYALATKIHFVPTSDGTPRAVGVTYTRHFQTRTAVATKEIILSAGAIGSPKILLASGVGPAEDMRKLGIPLVKDLPVGENFQDHAYTLVGPFIKGPSVSPKTTLNLNSALDLLMRGKGPLASPVGFAGQAFFQSPVAEPAYPDLQAIQFSVSLYREFPEQLHRILGLDASLLAKWLHPYHLHNVDARLVVILLGRPKSSGKISLRSRDPLDNPRINPRYLSHPDDAEAMLYGFKKIVDLFENTTALNTPLFQKPFPECKKHAFKSDDYYRCFIRYISGSFYHHVGSCALGKVVDSHLRVKGIYGLRVIDASVMPRTPNANTQAAAIMLGEKGTDLIVLDIYRGR